MQFKKTILRLSIFAVLFNVLPQSNTFANQYSDLSSSHPYYQAIMTLSDQGILQGYQDGTFKPNKSVTRAEFLKMAMLYNVSPDIVNTSDDQTCFPDVSGHWGINIICNSKEIGIVKGDAGDGFFRPERNVNLVEGAKMIVLSAELLEGDPIEIEADSENSWFTPYLDVLEQRNAIPPTVTDIDHKLTRAEVAEILVRSNTSKDGVYQDEDGNYYIDPDGSNTASPIPLPETADTETFEKLEGSGEFGNSLYRDQYNIYYYNTLDNTLDPISGLGSGNLEPVDNTGTGFMDALKDDNNYYLLIDKNSNNPQQDLWTPIIQNAEDYANIDCQYSEFCIMTVVNPYGQDLITHGRNYFQVGQDLYFTASKMFGADADTFKLLQGGNFDWMQEFARDQSYVYLKGEVVLGADPTSFMSTSSSWYYKDKYSVYTSEGLKIPKADALSFTPDPLNFSLAIDKDSVFYRGYEVPGADPKTFTYVNYTCARDLTNYYISSYPDYLFTETSKEQWTQSCPTP